MCLAGGGLVRALRSLQLVSFCQNEEQNSATGLVWQQDVARVLFSDITCMFRSLENTTVLSPGVPGLPVSLSWSGRGG